jgi:hypothetical protein
MIYQPSFAVEPSQHLIVSEYSQRPDLDHQTNNCTRHISARHFNTDELFITGKLAKAHLDAGLLEDERVFHLDRIKLQDHPA